MSLLDDAKIQIRAIKERPTGVVGEFTIGVHWQTLDTLVKIAEAAFEMPEQRRSLGSHIEHFCAICGGVNGENGLNHLRICPWWRIQELKKELEV